MKKFLIISVLTLGAMFGFGFESVKAAPKSTNKARTVIVQSGDTLGKIARRHNLSLKQILVANPQIKNPNKIYVGNQINLVATGQKVSKKPAKKYNSVKAQPTARKRQPVAQVPTDGSVWDRLARCESGGNWSINTGNGYFGGLQFNLGTWHSNGGSGYPHQASREEQIRVAENLRAARGFAPWPACSKKLGLR